MTAVTQSAVAPELSEWDVVVIGAGVGGSIAARELARRGCRVLLVDKKSFPRRKVCGSCLNASALHLLDQAGLSELVRDLGGVPLHRLALRTGDRQADVTLIEGRSVSREAFDVGLIEAAVQIGVEFRQETSGSIEPYSAHGSFRTISLTRHDVLEQVQARAVIVASGLGAQGLPSNEAWTSQPAPDPRVGASCVLPADVPEYERGTIWMAVGRQGYVGLVRLEDSRLNVAAALDREFLTQCKSPGLAVERLLTEARLPCPDPLLRADWQGTVSLTRHTTPLVDHRVFVIGDAASYVEPFTGEGMAWAIRSGLSVAPWAVMATSAWTSDIELGWTREYQRQITNQQRTCRVISRLLHNPRLQSLSMFVLEKFPWLARYAISK